jgi:hypothetical protein
VNENVVIVVGHKAKKETKESKEGNSTSVPKISPEKDLFSCPTRRVPVQSISPLDGPECCGNIRWKKNKGD